jgi:hypothetical protein
VALSGLVALDETSDDPVHVVAGVAAQIETVDQSWGLTRTAQVNVSVANRTRNRAALPSAVVRNSTRVNASGFPYGRMYVRGQRHDGSRHLVNRYLAVDVMLRNCQRPRIDVQPVAVQRAENAGDIVGVLSAKASFI